MAPTHQRTQRQSRARKYTPRQQFVLDVVRSAVALPQGDPQDRLRVLTAAAQVIRPVSPWLEKLYAREGAHLEADLISHGQQPVVSMIASGHIDCATAAQFVESVPSAAVPQAEQSLIGIISACPRQGLAPVRSKLDAALEEGRPAPRALMAVIERVGPKSAWAQAQFVKMFGDLPSDADKARADGPNFAAMYVSMAPRVEKEAAGSAGLKLLEWLSRIKESGERNLSVNMVTGSMREALGDTAYNEALSSNVVARGVAQTAGRGGQIERPPNDDVSVLAAMSDRRDRTDALAAMAPHQRAREAAAHGFASGTQGDRKAADRYFDLAFSAADEVWDKRAEHADAPAVVQEISEAAAHVDSVAALKRAQGLADPSAQAISMLAVARVVLGQEAAPSVRPR